MLTTACEMQCMIGHCRGLEIMTVSNIVHSIVANTKIPHVIAKGLLKKKQNSTSLCFSEKAITELQKMIR